MKKTTFLVTLCALCVGGVALSTTNYVAAGAAAPGWSEVGATTTQITNGANIIGSGWGARAHTETMFNLDGLEFDYEFANIASEHTAGFYFGSSHYYYAPETGEKDNALTFYFNSSATYYRNNQCRFGIFNTHAWNGKTTQSYTSTTLSAADGFGYSDGTLVMNKKDSHKFHFDFRKVDDTWFKVIMTELTIGSMWEGAEYNKNYDSTTHSTFVYVKASQIGFSEKGEVYLFAFGLNNSSMNITMVENNYQPVLSFCKSYLKMDTVPTTDHSDTGACLTAYATAKTEFAKLTDAQKNMFLSDARFADMVLRFKAWATRNGEVFADNGTFSSMNTTIGSSMFANNQTSIIAIISVLVVTTAVAGFFTFKKKKHY